MALRSGHGSGAGVPRIEVLPPDELPPASPEFAARTDRTPDGRFAPGNSLGRDKKVRPGHGGGFGIDLSLPEFRPFQRWGRRYGQHRRRELAAAHGGEISAGVGAIVESAALALAASRFLAHRGAAEGDPQLLTQSSRLAESARQHELASWELASREAQVRSKHRVNPIHAAILGAGESEGDR